MEIAKIIPHPAKQMTNQQKKRCALQAMNNDATVTKIAKQHKVSRKFVNFQKSKATAAIDQAFGETAFDEDKVLYHLPVTKAWIKQLALCLMLHGRASFRGIRQIMKDALDYDISPSSVHNITADAKQSAAHINMNQDLSSVKLAAHDEIFHQSVILSFHL